MANPIDWQFLDWNADAYVTSRNRPHIGQNALTFVTFRLNDSMPIDVIERWRASQRAWLQENGISNLDIAAAVAPGVLPEDLRRRLLKMHNHNWLESLDEAHGECWLRDPTCAQFVVDSLLHFNDVRYDLERFVVMPNHVHVLVQMRNDWRLQKQCTSWLRFTGGKINEYKQRQGRVWQPEPFDHVVRNEVQFEYLQRYIADNPRKANLKEGEYSLWIRS